MRMVPKSGAKARGLEVEDLAEDLLSRWVDGVIANCFVCLGILDERTRGGCCTTASWLEGAN